MNPRLARARKMRNCRALLLALVVASPLVCSLQSTSSQGTQRKEGKTLPAVIIPDETIDAGEVIFKGDSDHDGMLDEDEARNGTDPNAASDADGDADGDG